MRVGTPEKIDSSNHGRQLKPVKPGKRVRGRQGFVLFILFCILGLLLLVIFSLSTTSLQLRSTTVTLLDEQCAYQAALSSFRLFGILLEDALKRRAGCPVLFPPSGNSSPLDPTGGVLENLVLKADDIEEMKTSNSLEFLSKKFDIRNLDLESRFSLDPVSGGQADSWAARTGNLKTTVSLEYKKVRFSFGFSRDFKVSQILPRVTSKFTLFVRQCISREAFNTVEKGFQDPGANQKLLTLFNHPPPNQFGATKRDLFQTSGWVFLGGETNLNIDGTHPGFKQSEFFMFWPDHLLTPGMTRLPAAVTQPLPSKRSSDPGPFKVKVRFTPSGCMTDWVTNAMFQPLVGPQLGSYLKKISFLRLFGNKEFMSPTKIFGKVFARWALYSALIYDANDDGIADLNAPGESWVLPLPRIPSFDQYRPLLGRPLPVTAWGAGMLDGNMGNPDFPYNLDSVSPTWEDYVPLMTKLSSDFVPSSFAFNSLYDLMFDLGPQRKFPPELKNFLPDADYPNDGKDFQLPSEPGGTNIRFKTDLTVFDPLQDLEKDDFAGCAYRFSRQEEFLGSTGPVKRRLVGGRTEYYIDEPFTGLIEGDLTLPNPFFIEAPAVLLVKGKIRTGSIRKSPSDTQGAGMLVLVSLENDLQIAGDQLESVILMAPRGTLVPETDFALRGSLSVGYLDGARFRNFGGTVTFEPQFDQTVPASWNRGFVMILGPGIPSPVRGKDFL